MELTTIIFNVWTLFIFYRYPRLRIPINYILINLTINNLLYGFLILPFKIVSVLTQTWPFHPRICLLSGFINVVGFLVAVFSILAISVYRYLAIVRSQKRTISKRRVLFSIGFIWFGSAISAMLPLVGVGSYVYIPSAYMCMPDPYYNLFITLFFSTTSFILPVIFSGVLNWRLLVTVNKHSKRMQVTHQSCSFVRKDKGLTKAILSIYVGFFICFMPIGIVAYILLPLYVPVPRSVIIISSFMITIHSTTFPLICGLMHEKFKICYKQCLSDLVGGKLYRRRSGSLKSKSSFIRRTSTIRDFRCPDIQVHQASENHRSNYFIRSPMSMDNITSLLSKKRRHSTNIWRHKTFPVVQSPLPLDRAKKYSIPNTELELEDLTPSTVS
ncbi:uncharacterized protein TRIADDRAFT_58589 [Trichoplax adhaerens]|uniref:G-protein coupled receptors family 1 profile domain-containing protein n=1 Tax=Trichoplax adhaerens TaxID=10228 RepID=B3S345_TRIAD|nr:hypothetical protein TRIADDRAFT_58589 [Trichoplax adhaerens]EDV22906.1 hypothetical protein TRIADDRAFT_58589 [Trichoplax adhaerens]|eukprot:XP_002114772.1 hypothetical protein TRIADDRAFT_58589 [Trichoplax adhaerens]